MRIIDWSSDVCSSDLTSHIACQYGALGIRCNNVAPGVTVTPRVAGRLEDPLFKRINVEMTPNTRLGEIEDVNSTTAFLCSTGGSFINVPTLLIDGAVSYTKSLSHYPLTSPWSAPES